MANRQAFETGEASEGAATMANRQAFETGEASEGAGQPGSVGHPGAASTQSCWQDEEGEKDGVDEEARDVSVVHTVLARG